jgi:hypothetical protein
MNKTPTTENDILQNTLAIDDFWPRNTFICTPHPITEDKYHIQ